MKVVWQDAPVPIEYRTSMFSLGYVLKVITPIVVVLISMCFVVMSYYIAQDTLTVQESPLAIPPYYFLAVTSEMQHDTDPQKIITSSSVFSNFPQFNSMKIRVPKGGASLSSKFDDEKKFLTMNLIFPQTADPTYKLIQTKVLIPISFYFPKLDKIAAHTLLFFNYFSGNVNENIESVDQYGTLYLKQIAPLSPNEWSAYRSIDGILSSDLITDGDLLDFKQIYSIFDQSSIRPNIVTHSQNIKTSVNIAANPPPVNISITLRIPDMLIERNAPYWNKAKVTYVQLFYWMWFTAYLWNIFVQNGLKYGIFHSTTRNILAPIKCHAD